MLGEKFKDASIFYQSVSEINTSDLKRWLNKAQKIQWDYKNIVKRKGKLERLEMNIETQISQYVNSQSESKHMDILEEAVKDGVRRTTIQS